MSLRPVLLSICLASCATISTAGLGKLDLSGALTLDGQLRITVDAWARLSTNTGGVSRLSKGAADVPGLITEIFDEGVEPGGPVDLVFVVDTTGSMGDDISAVKADMHRIHEHLQARNPDHLIGVVAYRDKGDDYVSKTFLGMTPDRGSVDGAIAALKVGGGGDLREHVYAGLDTALREQPWRPHASHHIILMGDAPPHDDYRDDPRNFDNVMALAQTPQMSVRIHSIGIKCDLLCQALIGVGL